MRLFIAIDIPSARRELLAEVQFELPGTRWVPRENMHATVRFIGDVPDEQAHSIIRAVHAIDVTRFTVRVRGVGHFPLISGAGKPNVVWAGIGHSQDLQSLVARVEHAVVSCSVAPERRTFHGHVTLGRCTDSSWNDVQVWCAKHDALDFGLLEVSRVQCYESLQTSSGTVYRPVESPSAAREPSL